MLGFGNQKQPVATGHGKRNAVLGAVAAAGLAMVANYAKKRANGGTATPNALVDKAGGKLNEAKNKAKDGIDQMADELS